MARVTYSAQAKAEAIALAAVIGARAAGEQLGIGHRAIREWAERAGASVADTIDAPSWERLGALALARAESLVASGKLTAVQLATMAGIATRNAQRPKAEPAEAEPWSIAFDRWVADTYSDPEERRIALGIPSAVLRYAIRMLPETPPAADPHDVPPDDSAATLRWAIELVSAVDDLAAFDAESRRWQAESDHRERTIAARAAVLRESGMQYHEALSMARDISEDLEVTPPAWADLAPTDVWVEAAEAADDDSLDRLIATTEGWVA